MSGDAKEYIIIKHHHPTAKQKASLTPLTFDGRIITPDMDVIMERRWMTEREAQMVRRRNHIRDVQENQPVQTADTEGYLVRRIHNIVHPPRKGFRAQGMNVCVLDTGIDQTHYNRINARGYVAGTANFVDALSSVFPTSNDHGTWCAGMVSECVHQSQGWHLGATLDNEPDCKLSIARVLDESGNGTSADIVEGINYAVAQQSDVISISITGARSSNSVALSDVMTVAIEDAWSSRQIISAIAAGNNQSGSTLVADTNAPAVAPNGLTVANLQTLTTLEPGSAWGNCVDIAVLGYFVTSWALNGIFDHYLNGTSMATPVVAAAAAIIKSAGFTPTETKNALKSTAVPISGLNATQVGSGYLDVLAALKTRRYW